MDIPVLNLGDFVDGDQPRQDDFCRRLLASLSTLGFVKISNHSISDKVLDDVFEWSRRFFSLPPESKRQAAHPVNPNPHRGWSCVGQEKLSVIRQGKAVFDLKESFDQGPADDSLYPNIFPLPTTLPGFQPFMESFYTQCQDLHLSLLRAIALSLSQEETFFTARCGDNSSELRLNHYPAAEISDLQSGDMMRISSHTDFGTITLLFQDDVGGLEIESQDKPGVYIPVLPSPPSSPSASSASSPSSLGIGKELILNVGDCLQRWTNDRLRSANHRVTLPLTLHGATVPARYSVAYFGKPNREISVAAIPELLGKGEKVKYSGDMTAWEYNQSRLLQTY